MAVLGRHRARQLAATALVFVAAARPAAADSLSGYVEPAYGTTSGRTTDQSGRTQTSSTDALVQKYAVNAEKVLFPQLRLNGGWVLEKALVPLFAEGDQAGTRATNVNANLVLGGPVVSGSAGYQRLSQGADEPESGRMHMETFALVAGWKPVGLPHASLRLARPRFWEGDGTTQNRVSNDLSLAVGYQPAGNVDLRYSFLYANPTDRITGVESRQLTHSAGATWRSSVFNGRTQFFVSATGNTQSAQTLSAGEAGTVTTQQFPVAGLSLVEAFPAQPSRDTLVANPAMVDGNLTASAGLDLGTAPTTAGDNAERDLGAQFADGISASVTAVHVWVDRALPSAVWRAYSWTAWSSDDNVEWAPVNLAGPVQFAPFQNRFEIPIAPTRARYVKVVTRPLPPGATTDRRFANVLVTEVQFFQVVPASTAGRGHSSNSAVLGASAQTRLLAAHDLGHDISLLLTRTDSGVARTASSLVNGLSWRRKLGRVLGLNTRVSRRDDWQPGLHESGLQYAGALTAAPLRTLSAALQYSGQHNWKQDGTSWMQGVTATGKAELYRGIGLVAGAGYSLGGLPRDGRTTARQATVGTSIVPHRRLTLAAHYATDASTNTIGPTRTQTASERVDASVSTQPLNSLSLSGGVARHARRGQEPRLLLNAGLGFAPLRDGTLQASFHWNEAYDDLSDVLTRSVGPALHWSIRPSAQLDLGYSFVYTSAPAQTSSVRSFSAVLRVSL